MSRHTLRLAHTLLEQISPLHDLVQAIPNMPIRVRKTLLTICRIQPQLEETSRAYVRLKGHLGIYFPTPMMSTRETNLRTLLGPCNGYIQNPFYAGLINMFTRNLPYGNRAEVEELLEESVEKELRAATESYQTVPIDWQSMLSYNKTYRSTHGLLHDRAFDGDLNNQIFSTLCATKSQLSRMTIYPDYSNKTIGRRGTSDMAMINEALKEDFCPTPAGLESLYHRYGIMLDSPTEVRTAFKYNDIRPRVYYARGPAQYYSSRYIQQIFNTLVDAFPTTHRFQRFLVSSIRLTAQDTLFIYDYSSFTSTLHEVRRFTEQLAQFFDDTEINTVDSRVGVCRINLSELLYSYNLHCNMSPTFDVREVPGIIPEEEDLVHNCGMLGVPGNISSCTLLHGLFLMTILMTMECRVVGDDAIGRAPCFEDSIKDMISILATIGIVSIQKAEYWDDFDIEGVDRQDCRWHYTKRPIERLANEILFDDAAVVWPALGQLHSAFGDNLHTVIYPDSVWETHRRIANSMLSFAGQFASYAIGEEEINLANKFMWLIYEKTGMNHRDESGELQWIFDGILPISVEEGMRPDLITERMWNSRVVLPEYERILEPEWMLDIPCKMNGNRALKLARDLGYVVVEPRFRRFIVRDDVEYFERFLGKEHRFPVVDACVSSKTPKFLVDLIFPIASIPVDYYDQGLFSESDEED